MPMPSGAVVDPYFDVWFEDVATTKSELQVPAQVALVGKPYGEPEVLHVMSKKYALAKNRDAVLATEAAMRRAGYTVQVHRQYCSPTHFYRRYVMPEVSMQVNGDTDPVLLMLTMVNSYDRTRVLSFDLGAYRQVCSNRLMVGRSYHHMRMKHIGTIDLVDTAKALERAAEAMEPMVERWRAWNEMTLTPRQAGKLLGEVPEWFPRRYFDAAEVRYNRSVEAGEEPATVWGLYNAFTYVLTHEVEGRRFERAHDLGIQFHEWLATVRAA